MSVKVRKDTGDFCLKEVNNASKNCSYRDTLFFGGFERSAIAEVINITYD